MKTCNAAWSIRPRDLRPSLLTIAGACSIFMANPAIAGSAYGIRTQSTSVLGSAQAGMTAGPYDLSRISLNPAALGLGSGTEVTTGLSGIMLHQRAYDVSASTTTGVPLTGGNGGESGTTAAIPHFYSAFDIDDRMRLGFGTTSYYGLGSKWQPGWAGRYYAGSSSMLSADILSVISFRPIPSLIIAGGPVIEYLRLKTNTELDIGTVDQISGGFFGGTPGGSDGTLATRADSWSAGAILGATYEVFEGTRLGVSWRSQIRHKLEGDANFSPGGSVGQGISAATGLFRDTRLSSSLINPAVATFGISQEITPALTVFADVQHMGWSSVREATLNFANPSQPAAKNVLNLRDSWYTALGGRYQLNDRYAMRTGVGLDEPATRDGTRTLAIPDNFSVWTAVGLEVRLSDGMRLDFAYGHVFADKASINLNASQPGNEFRGNFSGKTRTTSDFFAMQIAWKF
jgi:long-chain fatty acid transport protein